MSRDKVSAIDEMLEILHNSEYGDHVTINTGPKANPIENGETILVGGRERNVRPEQPQNLRNINGLASLDISPYSEDGLYIMVLQREASVPKIPYDVYVIKPLTRYAIYEHHLKTIHADKTKINTQKVDIGKWDLSDEGFAKIRDLFETNSKLTLTITNVTEEERALTKEQFNRWFRENNAWAKEKQDPATYPDVYYFNRLSDERGMLFNITEAVIDDFLDLELLRSVVIELSRKRIADNHSQQRESRSNHHSYQKQLAKQQAIEANEAEQHRGRMKVLLSSLAEHREGFVVQGDGAAYINHTPTEQDVVLPFILHHVAGLWHASIPGMQECLAYSGNREKTIKMLADRVYQTSRITPLTTEQVRDLKEYRFQSVKGRAILTATFTIMHIEGENERRKFN